MRGIALKLVGMFVLATALVMVVIVQRASAIVREQVDRDQVLRGEAAALALVAAAEQDVESLTLAEGALASIRRLEGVRYAYLESLDGQKVIHASSAPFPARLRGQNRIGPRGIPPSQRTQVAYLDLEPREDGGPRERVIDLAAPISSRGAVSWVAHVGMDQGPVEERVSEARRRLFWLGAAVAGVGVGLGWLLVLVAVIRPVREMTRATLDIVATGDFTRKIGVRSRDEIGQLAEALSRLVDKLREVPAALAESFTILASAVNELTASAGEYGQTLARQTAALQETQATTHEIQQTSALASQKAEAVLLVTDRADEISRVAQTAIEQSLTGIADLRGRVVEIRSQIDHLSERTVQIVGITDTVKDLADQSNMLALNASIEAVRSGEHGKGFAVVAREIRSLADQSIKSTERVREILDDIADAIHRAIKSTEDGTAHMESGLVQVRLSGGNLKELSAIVRDNAASVRQIAAAVNQQNLGVTQIFNAVQDLSQMMEKNINRLDSVARSTAMIHKVASHVQQVVNAFKVKPQDGAGDPSGRND